MLCRKCKKEKNVFYEGIVKKYLDLCVECYEYRKAKDIEDRRKYYLNNKDKLLENKRKYYLNNKEKIKEYQESNRNSISIIRKEYCLNNKDKINEYRRFYHKNRIDNDELYKMSCAIRNSISISFKNHIMEKNMKTNEILGCSFDKFKDYIELKWDDWMSWDNYGKYNGDQDFGWDLDHIIPISKAETLEDVEKLNHYSNFQPLCSKMNRDVKKNNYVCVR